MRITMFVTATLLGVATTAAAQQGAAGKWELSYRVRDLQIEAVLQIAPDAKGQLTASWSSQPGESTISDVKFQDGKLTFTRDLKLNARDFRMSFAATIDGESVSGTLTSELGEVAVTGQRTEGPPAAQARATAQQQPARANASYPPELPGSRAEIYKTVGDAQLNLYIFEPEGHRPTDRRPAIVFFFGGGFRQGTPAQFEQHCQHFASRGIVAITADYRVSSRHNTTPTDSVIDGKDAMRWVRANSTGLGIDPQRIVSSGGSAGGLVAACVGVIPSLDTSGDNDSVSYLANAMVLFNPAWMGVPTARPEDTSGPPRYTSDILPLFHVGPRMAPSIMFFGTEDRLLAGAEEFQKAARSAGNRCDLMTWNGLGHGFFNFGRNENKPFEETLRAADDFLVSLGYLSPR